MREIKFRGQRVDTKEWVYGYYIGYSEIHGKASIYCRHEDESGAIRPSGCSGLIEEIIEVIPETVGQFAQLLLIIKTNDLQTAISSRNSH